MLKLHAGISRKVGLPGYSSASASCHIEAELDGSLLTDTDGFQIIVQRAYQSCEQAVTNEIARLQHNSNSPPTPSHEIITLPTRPACRSDRITTISDRMPNPRAATAPQVRAIRAICARRHINLVRLLRKRYGLTSADELGIREASILIDDLKSDDDISPSDAVTSVGIKDSYAAAQAIR